MKNKKKLYFSASLTNIVFLSSLPVAYNLLIADQIFISDKWYIYSLVLSFICTALIIFYVQKKERKNYERFKQDHLSLNSAKDFTILSHNMFIPFTLIFLFFSAYITFAYSFPSIYTNLYGKKYNYYFTINSRQDIKRSKLACKSYSNFSYENRGYYRVEIPEKQYYKLGDPLCINKENKEKIKFPANFHIKGYESFFGKTLKSYKILNSN